MAQQELVQFSRFSKGDYLIAAVAGLFYQHKTNSKCFIMQLNIKTIAGALNKFIVQDTDKVSYLKQLIQEKIGLAVVQQRLVIHGRILPDDVSIVDAHLKNGDTIQLMLMLKGGGSVQSSPPY